MEGSEAPGEELAEPPEGVYPFHAVAFDHAPTSLEIDAALRAFLASEQGKAHQGVVTPGDSLYPAIGYKLVTLMVTTSDHKNDGTDHAGHAYFRGTWLANTGVSPAYAEQFVLDKPGRDDLDRGSTDVFYYTLRLASYVPGATADTFQRGLVGNSNSDRWRCESVVVDEKNYLGSSRGQYLIYDYSVQTPSPIESPSSLATNTASLYIGG